MPLDRRSLLKALALVPGLPILNSKLAQALMSQGAAQSSYVLLHGMWFMEFDGNGHLLAATPQHQAHHFHIRPHQQPLQALPPGDLDLTSTLGTTGKVAFFPTDILQFSAAAVQISYPRLPKITKFQTRITLPLPKLIFAFRSDTTDDFPAAAGKVRDSMLTFAGPRLATITCLEYDPGSGGPTVTSYYAEHPAKANSTAVNAALGDAADSEFLGPNFNLIVNAGFVPDACRDTDDSLPMGVLGDDEATLREIQNPLALFCVGNLSAAAKAAPNPTSKTAKPAAQQTSRQATSKAKTHSAAQPKAGLKLEKAADIASCPQFGINP